MLTDRQLFILQMIIDDFIRSAQPVGSRTFPRKRAFPSVPPRSEMKWQILRKWGLLKKHIRLRQGILLKKGIVITSIIFVATKTGGGRHIAASFDFCRRNRRNGKACEKVCPDPIRNDELHGDSAWPGSQRSKREKYADRPSE